MIDTARQRLAGFGERINTQQADATRLTFPDSSFNVVVSFIMLHHVMNWEKAIGEAARVLRPGGLLIGYDLLASPPLRVFHQLERSTDRTRLMRLAELRTHLRHVPLVGSIQPSLGGLTVRFALTKP
jgi:ubiquinone/menaquinone biosynthesis C-methylase UbiE